MVPDTTNAVNENNYEVRINNSINQPSKYFQSVNTAAWFFKK